MTNNDIIVEELFEDSDLSSEPVFVACIDDRDAVTVAENGVEITRSNVQFSFFEPGEIGVLTVGSDEEGDFSALMDHVCNHFGATDVVFINVISVELAEKLHGFELTERVFNGCRMDCLEGTWDTDRYGRESE